jgi:hypothetical protein
MIDVAEYFGLQRISTTYANSVIWTRGSVGCKSQAGMLQHRSINPSLRCTALQIDSWDNLLTTPDITLFTSNRRTQTNTISALTV